MSSSHNSPGRQHATGFRTQPVDISHFRSMMTAWQHVGSALALSVFTACATPDPLKPPTVEAGVIALERLDTGLPIVTITTHDSGTRINREVFSSAHISINAPDNSDRAYTGQGQIRGRGNTSWRKPKKSYRIQLDEAHDLFGLPADRDWVLLANHQDPTMLLNTIALQLGQRLGIPFTNHSVHVELVLNGVYQGSYVLTEQIEVGPGRVDVQDGILVEMDNHYDSSPKFTTSAFGLPIMIKHSGTMDTSSIRELFNTIEGSLVDSDMPPTHRDLLDMESLVEYTFLNDFLMNVEMDHPKSVYMHMPPGGKLRAGPLWDFDWGYAYAKVGRDYFTSSSTLPYTLQGPGRRFFNALRADSAFAVSYDRYWHEHRAIYSEMGTYIDSMAQVLYRSQRLNFERWQWPDSLEYTTEVQRLRNWWRERVAYFDTDPPRRP